MTQKDVLANSIQKWLEGKGTRSLPMLAKKAGVSYSSVRRAANKESESGLEIVLNVSLITMSQSERQNFLDNFFPNLETYTKEAGYSKDEVSGEFVDYLLHRDYSLVLLLAATDRGTSWDEVNHYLGVVGLRTVKELVSQGYLLESGNRLLPKYKSFGLKDPKKALKLISLWTELFDFDPDLKGTATYNFTTEKLNIDAIRKINDLEKKHAAEKLSIIKQESSKGDLLFFNGSYTDVLKGEE